MIRVLIADDQKLMCDGLKTILESKKDIQVVALASSGSSALLKASEYKPDLILLDIRMPGMDGVETVLRLKEKFSSIKVIMLTTFNDKDYIMDAIANGADGYLLKDMETQELVEAIRNVMKGNLAMPSSVADNLKKGLSGIKKQKKYKLELEKAGLNKQEIKIASLMAKGFTNSQIATALYLSQGTIRNYVSCIYRKLNVEDRTNAVLALKDFG